jgi:glycosyltransferase involved in cell wall biosynthesis
MNVVIFGDRFSFPDGSAATNRVYTYARGLIENGINVNVVCFESRYNSAGNGQINMINYYHPFGQIERSKYFVVRRYYKFLKYFKTVSLLRSLNKKDKTIAIYIYTNLLLTHLFSWFLAKITDSKLIIEGNEHPLRHFQANTYRKAIGLLKFYIESYCCDAIFCISHFLIDFHKSKGISGKKLFLVPSTVDPARFYQANQQLQEQPYIGYFGGLTFYRDNVDLLIKAFARVSKKNDEVILVLGGFCSDDEQKQITGLISELNIQSKVKLLGYIEREEVTRYIVNAKMLVMVRSNNLEAKASYPSKLSEFLASSKPVISVNVGEIPLYITDGVNAFLVEPENVDALANKIEYVLSNYEMAKEVGLRGKGLTDTVFNYNYQGKRMIEHIFSLN